jgi:Major Facilitator Superfamily
MNEQGRGSSDSLAADPFAVLRSRYLVSAMVIHFGEYMAMMVTAYLVFHKTHSVVDTGLILVSYNAPSLFLARTATSLSRRWGAPQVDACINAAEGLFALVPMVLGFTHHLTTTALLLWVLSYGICEGLNAPNTYLVRQHIAADGQTHELNSAYTRNVALAAVLGMLGGGAIYLAAGPGWVFFVCAVTVIPEVLVFVAIARRVTKADTDEWSSAPLGETLRILRTEPGLWAACRFAALSFFVASYTVTLPAIANSFGTNVEYLSLLESGSVLGGVLVAVVVKRIHGRVRWGKVQRTCYVAAGVGLAAIAGAEYAGGAHSRVAALVAFVATLPMRFAVLMNGSIVTSLIQIGTPLSRRASMFTLLALIPLVVGPVSQELVGVLADQTSIATALGIVAVVTIVANSVISHRPMSQHFDRLNEMDLPFHVNELAGHRTAHRGHLHVRHWPESIT